MITLTFQAADSCDKKCKKCETQSSLVSHPVLGNVQLVHSGNKTESIIAFQITDTNKEPIS